MAAVLALGAALLQSTNLSLWAFLFCLILHAMSRLKSTPLIAVLLAPHVLSVPFAAAQYMAAAAYFFFFVALDMEPRSAGNPAAPTTIEATTCTEPAVANPVSEV